MADTSYQYSILGDFPNQKVAPDKLAYEIGQSSIASASYLYMQTSGDDCNIWFDDPLSGGDQTTLSGLVAAHDGDGYVYPIEIPESDAPDALKDDGGQWYDDSDGSMNWLAGTTDRRRADGIWGAEFADAADLTASTTTSTTFQQKLRLSVTGIPAGRYRVGFKFSWAYSATAGAFGARVQVDDTTGLFSMYSEPPRPNVNDEHSVGAFSFVTLTAGDHDIDLDYRVERAGDTARIENARIEFWRVS